MNKHPAVQANPSLNPAFRRRWQPVGSFRPVGEVVDEVLHDLAQRSVRHWLREAEKHEGDRRTACLATAASIARRAGLDAADIIRSEAA